MALPATLKKRLPLIVGGVVVIGLIVGGVIWWQGKQRWEATDNAFVEADTTLVSPQISGRVVEVLVGDNQRVEAGQVLVRLDDSDQKAELAQAEANLQAAEAAVGNVDAQAAQEEATIAAAKEARRVLSEKKSAEWHDKLDDWKDDVGEGLNKLKSSIQNAFSSKKT